MRLDNNRLTLLLGALILISLVAIGFYYQDQGQALRYRGGAETIASPLELTSGEILLTGPQAKEIALANARERSMSADALQVLQDSDVTVVLNPMSRQGSIHLDKCRWESFWSNAQCVDKFGDCQTYFGDLGASCGRKSVLICTCWWPLVPYPTDIALNVMTRTVIP